MRWLLCLILAAPFERIVATIDGKPITTVELGRYQALFQPDLSQRAALDQLIRLLVLDLQAQRFQIEAPAKQVAQQLARWDPHGEIRRRWAMDNQELRVWAVRQVRVQTFLFERFYRWQRGPPAAGGDAIEAEIDALVRQLEARWDVRRQL